MSGREQAQRFGRRAEALAAWWLRFKGYRIVARDVRGGAGRSHPGQIDLIARRGRILAFVEVKARDDRDSAARALSSDQRTRIARAAQSFAARRPDLHGLDWRFDLIVVARGRLPRHLPDAWRP